MSTETLTDHLSGRVPTETLGLTEAALWPSDYEILTKISEKTQFSYRSVRLCGTTGTRQKRKTNIRRRQSTRLPLLSTIKLKKPLTAFGTPPNLTRLNTVNHGNYSRGFFRHPRISTTVDPAPKDPGRANDVRARADGNPSRS